MNDYETDTAPTQHHRVATLLPLLLSRASAAPALLFPPLPSLPRSRQLSLHARSPMKPSQPPDPDSHSPLTTEPAASLSSCVLLPQQGSLPRVQMPWVAFGTYKLVEPTAAVANALKLGYRHVDSAFVYGGEKTEPATGKALRAALELGQTDRSDLFVTTKQWRKVRREHVPC